MGDVKCRRCGNPYYDVLDECPYCGEPNPDAKDLDGSAYQENHDSYGSTGSYGKNDEDYQEDAGTPYEGRPGYGMQPPKTPGQPGGAKKKAMLVLLILAGLLAAVLVFFIFRGRGPSKSDSASAAASAGTSGTSVQASGASAAASLSDSSEEAVPYSSVGKTDGTSPADTSGLFSVSRCQLRVVTIPFSGRACAYVIVEVKNISESGIVLKDSSFSINSADGTAIESVDMKKNPGIYGRTGGVIDQGGVGYYYTTNGIFLPEGTDTTKQYTLGASFNISASGENDRNYGTSEVSYDTQTSGYIGVTGTVTNSSPSDSSLCHVVIVFTSADGTPLCTACTDVSGLKAGASAPFECGVVSVPPDFDMTSIAGCTAYAGETVLSS